MGGHGCRPADGSRGPVPAVGLLVMALTAPHFCHLLEPSPLDEVFFVILFYFFFRLFAFTRQNLIKVSEPSENVFASALG